MNTRPPPTGEPHPGDWLTTSEAADILKVHRNTVKRWADTGKLPHIRTPGGHIRIRRATITEVTS